MPSSDTSSSSWKYDAFLLLSVLAWGLNFPILKGVLATMHPHVVNLFRFAIAGLTLGGLYAWRNRHREQSLFHPFRTHGRQIVLLGLTGYLFYQFFFILGIDNTTAGNAALIMTSSPLWTALLGHVFRFDRLVPAAWLALLVSLAGTVVVVIAGTQEVAFSSDTFRGNSLMLVAALLWGAYTVFNKPVLRSVSPLGLTFLGLIVAFPFLVALAIPYFAAVPWQEVTWLDWVAIVYSGGLSIGVAVALWNLAVKAVGPSNTAVYNNLVPFVALIAGYFLLGEPITLAQVLGGVLIIGGLVLMRRVRMKRLAELPS